MTTNRCIGVILCVLILGLLGLLIYYLCANGGNTRKYAPYDEYFTGLDMYNAGVQDVNVQSEDRMVGIDGNLWLDIIKNEDLRGTGVEETNAEFVEKASQKSYATTALRFQEFDHDRDPIDYMGLRRYNYAGMAAMLDGAPRRVTSERSSDYQPKPVFSLNYPTEFDVSKVKNSFDPDEI
jgi:hypothetical protein